MAALSLPESATQSPTQNVPLADLLARIRTEYVEMPGLKLTMPQARRLWGLDGATCDAALAALVNAKFLSRTCEGLFVMATSGGPEHMLRSGSVTTGALGPVGTRRHSPVPSRGRQEIWSANFGQPTAVEEVGIDLCATHGSRHDQRRRTDWRFSGARYGPM